MILSGETYLREIGEVSDNIYYDIDVDFLREGNQLYFKFDDVNFLILSGNGRVYDAESNFIYGFDKEPINFKGWINRKTDVIDYYINDRLFASEINTNNTGPYTGFYIDATNAYVDLDIEIKSKGNVEDFIFPIGADAIYDETGLLRLPMINNSGNALHIYDIYFDEGLNIYKDARYLPTSINGFSWFYLPLRANDPVSGLSVDFILDTNFGRVPMNYSILNRISTGEYYYYMAVAGTDNLYLDSGTGASAIYAVEFDTNIETANIQDLFIELNLITGTGDVSGLFTGFNYVTGHFSGSFYGSGKLQSDNVTGFATIYNGVYNNQCLWTGDAVTTGYFYPTGDISFDFSANGISNIDTLIVDPYMTVATFSGFTNPSTSTYLEVVNTKLNNLDHTKSWCFAGYFNPADSTFSPGLVSKFDSATTEKEYLLDINDATNKLRLYLHNGTGQILLSSSNTVNYNQWNFGGFGFEKGETLADGKMWVYLNGTLTTGTYNTTIKSGTSQKFNFGAWGGDGTTPNVAYSGLLSCWGHWNEQSLKSGQLDRLYNNGVAFTENRLKYDLRTGLTNFWRLDGLSDYIGDADLNQGGGRNVLFTGKSPTLSFTPTIESDNSFGVLGITGSGAYYSNGVSSVSGIYNKLYYGEITGRLTFNFTNASGGRLRLFNYEVTGIPTGFFDLDGNFSGNPNNEIFTGYINYNSLIPYTYTNLLTGTKTIMECLVQDGVATFTGSWNVGYATGYTGLYNDWRSSGSNYYIDSDIYPVRYTNTGLPYEDLEQGNNILYVKVDYYNDFDVPHFDVAQLSITYGTGNQSIIITGRNNYF